MLNKFKPFSIIDILGSLEKMSDNSKIYFKEFSGFNNEVILPFTVELGLRLEGKLYSAWGQSTNKDEAILKATMELIERIAIKGSKVNDFLNYLSGKELTLQDIELRYPKATSWLSDSSSGVAIHNSKERAFDNALAELVERHSVLKALVEAIAPKHFDGSKLLNKFRFPDERHPDFFYWIGPFDLIVMLCRFRTSKGQYFGLGASKSLNEAAEKSLYELSGRLYRYLGLKEEKEQLETSLSLNPNMKFHENNFSQELESLLELNGEGIIPWDSISKKDLFYCEYTIPVDLRKYNLNVVRVACPLMQPLFKGSWSLDQLNGAAFDQWPVNLPNFSHMIG